MAAPLRFVPADRYMLHEMAVLDVPARLNAPMRPKLFLKLLIPNAGALNERGTVH